MTDLDIAPATSADYPAIEALLIEAGLPLDGARGAFGTGVIARAEGRVVAGAALERYGRHGLLRSVVVAPDARARGVGRAVVAAAEALAIADGIDELYLITETAVDWFPRLGYAPIDRALAAEAVGESVEFTTACRDTGQAMHKSVRRDRGRSR